ncbi:RNase A-like domain-containing protein [Shouchella clausii]|uniref:RNase A-like domain-containing protein n=1 Tax=Shouchella clausii TaxID=79880 RepID=UPI000682BEF2
MPVLAPMGSRIRITLALFDPAADFFFGDFITLADPEASLGEKALATTFILVKPAKVAELGYDLSKVRKVETGGNVKPGDKSSLASGGGLAAHEVKGGHLIERHVGKTDEELLERIRNNPRINGSSTFKDRAIAEKVASEVLNDINNKKIESWLSNPQSKSNLVLTYEGTEVIGRGVKRGSTTVENMTNARIVLKKGWRRELYSNWLSKLILKGEMLCCLLTN